MIVGITGFARCGKDEAASYLSFEHGFIRLAFADKLRELVEASDPVVHDYSGGYVRYTDAVARYGYPTAKNVTGVRQALIRTGVAARKVLAEDVWVDPVMAAIDAAPNEDYVISDVRYPNEAQAIKERGGVVVLLKRSTALPAGSEEAMSVGSITPSFTVDNDGTIEELQESLDKVLTMVALQRKMRFEDDSA